MDSLYTRLDMYTPLGVYGICIETFNFIAIAIYMVIILISLYIYIYIYYSNVNPRCNINGDRLVVI